VAWVASVQSGGQALAATAPAPVETAAATPVAAVAPPPPAPTARLRAPLAASDADSAPALSAAKSPAAPPKAAVGDSIKVDIDKLDGLVNAVGELVIMQAMVRSNPKLAALSDPKLTKDIAQLSRITSELQKTAMSMRMVPIRQTFQKMIRLVRDLSKKTGKEVNLVMEGEETEIDRNMVDSIYDPLVHMMRNSVDHGVQPPVEREKLGKPRSGTVNLRAYQKGGYMVIEIEDDGQGLNTEKIRRKAIERGLIHDTDKISGYDLNNLIFLPGFSTADTITDVSGRGVGMDVVKKAVEKLRGKVEAISEPGKGSLFVIRLPLTLAIIDGIIVRVGSERYIIPTTAIQESLKPRRESYNTVQGKGETLMVRGTILPIIRLYQLFQVTPTQTDPCEAIVVVVEYEGRQRAIMVDELLGKQEVVIKNLGGLNDIPGVAGGTILGDGRVGLILDLAGIIQSHSGHGSVEESPS
jgi:two-component system chemotaxis sensor kinase CheA